MCVYTSHQPYRYPSFTLCSWQQTHWNLWCNSQHLCCHYAICWLAHGTKKFTCNSFNHIKFLSLTSWHCVHPRCIRTLIDIVITNPTRTDLFLWSYATQGLVASNATQAKEKNYNNQHLTNIPLFKYLVVYTNMLMCFYMIVSMPFGAWKGQRALIFLLWSFFSINFFDHITKDVNIFHLNSGGNYRFNYSQLPPFHNTPPITTADYCRLLVCDIKIWATYHKRLVLNMERF
jgi:hypothetical protein